MTQPDWSDADAREEQYWRELRQSIRRARENGATTLDEVLAETDGAFPSDVLRVAGGLRTTSVADATSRSGSDRLPHPSPAHGEYYFTQDSSEELAELAIGDSLCLGTPSVAVAIARAGGRVRLVDSSPWLESRFQLSKTSIHHINGQTVESMSDLHEFDTAIIDPPWYAPALLDWVRIASRAVKRNGVIFMPILPPLTRPGARSDRDELLALGDQIGSAKLLPLMVRYEPSRFERAAVARAGGILSRPWRQAHVMMIANTNPTTNAPKSSFSNTWVDRRVGDAIISIDPSRPRVDRCVDEFYKFDTVSRRDFRIKEANVWTSESTGATLRDPRALIDMIDAADPLRDEADSALGEILMELEIV